MLTIPANQIEPIIFKLALFGNPKYMGLLTNFFKKTWFDDKNLASLLDLSVKYYQKYNKRPNKSTLDLMVAKYFPDKEQCTQLLMQIKSIYDYEVTYDEEFIDSEIVTYLTNTGLYNVIMTSLEDIEKNHNVDKCLDEMRKLSTMTFEEDIGFDYFQQIDKHLDELSNPEAKMSTGWDEVDAIFEGGLPIDGRCLVTYIGETHIGKSLFLSNLASNLIRNNKFVIIISLEMSELIYGQRIDAHLSELNVNKIRFHTDDVKKIVQNINNSNPKAKLLIKEFPPDSMTCNHLKSYIDKSTAYYNRKPDCIIVDYINLLMPNGKENNDGLYTKVGTIVKQLRALSYIYRIPVISASQVNRSGYSSTDPKLDQTGESMGIAHTSDAIFAIWQNEGDKDIGIINTTVLKNRLGGQQGKSVSFNINYENLTITDNHKTDIRAPEEIINQINLINSTNSDEFQEDTKQI